MYHAIVRKKVRQAFDAVSRGDASLVLSLFGRRFEHVFLGEHALGGTRTTLARTEDWYARLYRLLPDIRFEVGRIWVSGGPWNTLVVVEWEETNSATDGVRTYNRGIHAMHMRWGRATQLFICPDTTGLVETLVRLGKKGSEEASAQPITG